jgi:hypothetical protein
MFARLTESPLNSTATTLASVMSRGLVGMLLVSSAASTHAQVEAPPKHPVLDNNGVDVQSGQVYYPHTELAIGGGGIGGLTYTRYYNGNYYGTDFDSSFSTDNQWFGQRAGTVIFGRYFESFDFFYASEPTGSRAVPNDGTGLGDYTRKDGLHVRFGYQTFYRPPDSDGHSNGNSVAEYAEFPNGVRWTYHYRQFAYDGLTYYRIQSITSNAGYQLKYYYASNITPTSASNSGAWKQVVRVVAINNAQEYCDPLADACTLSLSWPQVQDSLSGNVLTVTEADGGQARYTKTPTQFLIKKAGSSTDNIVYSYGPPSGACYPNGACGTYVTSANLGGNITTYSYYYNSVLKRWVVTALDPLSGTNTYMSKIVVSGGLFNYLEPGVSEQVDALGRSYSFTHTRAADVLTATHPEGNWFEYTRDGDGNLQKTTIHPKSSSSLANIVESQTGPDNAPTSRTDARGNVTNYTYQFDSPDGVLTETAPADASGIRPVRRYAYAQRYAWIKNSSGGYVRAPTPLWVRTEERTCSQTATVGNACSGGGADEVVTTYDYGPDSGPNNLLLRGKVVTVNGISLRACYGYDIYGNKISETSPRAGLANCS